MDLLQMDCIKRLIADSMLDARIPCKPRGKPAGCRYHRRMDITHRDAWIRHADKIARPVLSALAKGKLKATMPVESAHGHTTDRRNVTHLEALGRTLAGLSPWLAAGDDPAARELAPLAQQSIAMATDPASPDYMAFKDYGQAVVDAAFLSHAVLRAPDLLWHGLDATTRKHFVAAMKLTRHIKPAFCNWLLFSAMVETFLAHAGEEWDAMRVDYAVRQHLQWYKGDGVYGDGPWVHNDYYNSYVIQPMLLDIVETLSQFRDDWKRFAETILQRAQRHAAVQERLIAPDGSFPVTGRSITYRCGAFQMLAQLALQDRLPPELPAAQAKTALSAVISRTLDAPDTCDADGWLRIGLAGHQPSLGERYISTGSLYLCSVGLLPLGRKSSDAFWTTPAEPTTWQKAWRGDDLAADHAMHDSLV
jgi:hypothetical protein